MARKITPEHLAAEFWVVESVEAGRYHGNVTLSDLHCWIPGETDDDDVDDVPPGTKDAECMEHSEHRLTVPVSSQTRLRPGMAVRIAVEQVA